MANCRQCGNVLESMVGKESKIYCSDACRKTWNRQHRTEATPDKPTPDTLVMVTPDTTEQTPERRAYKRGKDIKCFEDLPADIQEDIVLMSASKAGNDEVMYQQERANRTERAIEYQRQFPDRFYPGGREIAGPRPDDFELCRYCGKSLPALRQPRHSPGACLPCVTAKYEGKTPCNPPANRVFRPAQVESMGASTIDTVATLHRLCKEKANQVQA